MEWLTLTLGGLLRLGIPLALTALAVWWLRRLDARWQREAEYTLQLTRAQLTTYRPCCWEVRNCPPERRATCAAFTQPGLPCWQVFRDSRGWLKDECLDCAVFQQTPAPAPVALPRVRPALRR
jgi:hypothetical protein